MKRRTFYIDDELWGSLPVHAKESTVRNASDFVRESIKFAIMFPNEFKEFVVTKRLSERKRKRLGEADARKKITGTLVRANDAP